MGANRRIKIPIQVVNGSVAMIEDEESDYQSLLHHISARPGSHPLTRMLGTEFKYQVSIYTALDCVFDLRMNLYRYESNAILTDITPIIDEDTLRVQLSWKSLNLGRVKDARN